MVVGTQSIHYLFLFFILWLAYDFKLLFLTNFNEWNPKPSYPETQIIYEANPNWKPWTGMDSDQPFVPKLKSMNYVRYKIEELDSKDKEVVGEDRRRKYYSHWCN